MSIKTNMGKLTVESDMQIRSSNGELEARIFAEYPLIGSKMIDRETSQKIVMFPRKYYYSEHYRKEKGFDLHFSRLIVIALIHYAKRWDHEKEPDFWNYIALQLGFRNTENVRPFLQKALEYAIKNSNRFFLEGDKRRSFKATLLLHAFSPRKAWMNLLDFLDDFYKENLHWTIHPGEPLIGVMVKALGRMFDKDCEEDVELRISSRAYSFQEGIRKLILLRPQYTQNLFEEIIAKIDVLRNTDREVAVETYQDQLCNEWFQEKLERLANEEKKERRRQAVHREVAFDYSRINPRYVLENEVDVQLVLPDIRLGSNHVGSATLVIECNGNISRSKMRIYGNELGETLDGGDPISLSGLMQGRTCKEIQLRLEIVCDEEVIYDSEEKLYRQTLVFDGEREVRSKTLMAGRAYTLACPAEIEIEHTNETEIDDFQLPGWHAYFLELQKGYAVIANGVPLYFDVINESGLRVIKPPESSRLPWVQMDGRECFFAYRTSVCNIFAGDAAKFWVLQDGERIAVSPSQKSDDTDRKIYGVPFPDERKTCRIQVIDQCSERMLFDETFVLIESAESGFNRDFYYSEEDYEQAVYHICIDGSSTDISFSREDEEAAVPFRKGEIHARIPKIVLKESTGLLLNGEKDVWMENISQTSKLEVVAPSGIDISFLVGERSIHCTGNGSLLLGDSIHSYASAENVSSVPVRMEAIGPNQSQTYDLACVYCREQFLNSPKIWIKEGKLYWDHGGRFIGAPGKEFSLSLRGESCSMVFSMNENTESIELPTDLNVGIYQYEISVSDENPFQLVNMILAKGECSVGSPNLLRFRNRRILLESITDGLREDQEFVHIRPCYVDQIEFQGEEETAEGWCPVYHGVMYTQGDNGERFNFSFHKRINQRNRKKIKVNPVRIVYVNESLLSVTDLDGDGLYYYHYYDKDSKREIYAITDQEYTEQNKNKYSVADFYLYQTERI